MFRLSMQFQKLFKAMPSSGVLYCMRDPELLKDSGWLLASRGYRFSPIAVPAVSGEQAVPGSDEGSTRTASASAVSDAMDMVKEMLTGHVSERNLERCLGLIRGRLQATAKEYEALYARATQVAANAEDNSALAGANFTSPADIALASAFKAQGHPVFSFAHGTSRRIAQSHKQDQVTQEDLLSSVHFDFAPNRSGEEGTDGPDVVVGTPKFYTTNTIDSFMTKPSGVWYISSALYMAACDKLHRAMSDHNQCRFEEGIVRQVLGKIDKPVMFKPYPAVRFLETDPVEDAAREVGLTVFDEPTDLRYEIHKAEVLIVSRSGSTLGYCLLQDKPLVYIQAPGRDLKPDVQDAFSKGVFFFRATDDGFLSDLRDFLNRPMTEIQEQWRSKSAHRKALIRDYIGMPDKSGPRITADTVSRTMEQRRSPAASPA